MSRVHNSVPLKSKAFRTPVPVMTQTVVPSVTGEGVDMFCLRCWLLPPPSGRFHMTSPLLRSTDHSSSSPVVIAVATFRKIWLPQMIGVDPLRLGIGSFHAMFSSIDHLIGSPFSALTPLSLGPRHCGQF